MSDKQIVTNPHPVAPFLGTTRDLRFHEVVDNNCAPVVMARDYVLIAPVDDYCGEGFYLVLDYFGTPVLYHCSGRGSRGINLGYLNTLYEDKIVPVEEFRDIVLGKVVMTCKMQDSRFLRRT